MSDYVIANGQLCHADDVLAHYGVKGMKWGQRKKNYKGLKSYAKAGGTGVVVRSSLNPITEMRLQRTQLSVGNIGDKTYNEYSNLRGAIDKVEQERAKLNVNKKFNKAVKKELKRQYVKDGEWYRSKDLPDDPTHWYKKDYIIDDVKRDVERKNKSFTKSVRDAEAARAEAERQYNDQVKTSVDELLGRYGKRTIRVTRKDSETGKKRVQDMMAKEFARTLVREYQEFQYDDELYENYR